MSLSAQVPRVFRFGVFEVDPREGELRKSGLRIKLQDQPLQLLVMLLERPGEIVTREELQRRLWSADTFVDFDHSLNSAIKKLREALGDQSENPRFIETLHRRGYRFIAPVETQNSGDSGTTVLPSGTPSSGAIRPDVKVAPRSYGKRAKVLTSAVGLLGLTVAAALLLGLNVRGWRDRVFMRSPKPQIPALAVLPLTNLSGDPEQEYFADGMTEELITELSRIHALKVISRTSVMEYKGTKKHLPQIARELGVDGIVEGSVIREGDQVRITVQLLDGPNDRHIWSEEYQRELRGILILQREMAEAITQQIRIQLTPQEQARISSGRVANPEAYEAYLRGRFYLTNQLTMAQPLNMAQRYFEEAIQKDPGFALGYVGLADSYVYLALFNQLSPERAYGPAEKALRRALELDDSIGEAHDTLGVLSWRFEWDLDAAEREFNQAITLAPSYSCAHEDRSVYLSFAGRRAEALAEMAKSSELDPGPSSTIAESGVYYQLRDYKDLVEASRRGLASNPNEWYEHYQLGVGYEGTGKLLEAISEYQKAVEMSDGDPDSKAALAHTYAVIGRRAEAEKILRDLERKSKSVYVSPYFIATIYAGLGGKNKAFELLERAYRERCLDLSWFLTADLRIDNLRSDPRFQNLLRRVGLTDKTSRAESLLIQ
jgi:TolB-like protein/DNA-binding winged helix-turn-helix (wHTH) protein/Flp pilus assembly protein TadD